MTMKILVLAGVLATGLSCSSKNAEDTKTVSTGASSGTIFGDTTGDVVTLALNFAPTAGAGLVNQPTTVTLAAYGSNQAVTLDVPAAGMKVAVDVAAETTHVLTYSSLALADGDEFLVLPALPLTTSDGSRPAQFVNINLNDDIAVMASLLTLNYIKTHGITDTDAVYALSSFLAAHLETLSASKTASLVDAMVAALGNMSAEKVNELQQSVVTAQSLVGANAADASNVSQAALMADLAKSGLTSLEIASLFDIADGTKLEATRQAITTLEKIYQEANTDPDARIVQWVLDNNSDLSILETLVAAFDPVSHDFGSTEDPCGGGKTFIHFLAFETPGCYNTTTDTFTSLVISADATAVSQGSDISSDTTQTPDTFAGEFVAAETPSGTCTAVDIEVPGSFGDAGGSGDAGGGDAGGGDAGGGDDGGGDDGGSDVGGGDVGGGDDGNGHTAGFPLLQVPTACAVSATTDKGEERPLSSGQRSTRGVQCDADCHRSIDHCFECTGRISCSTGRTVCGN